MKYISGIVLGILLSLLVKSQNVYEISLASFANARQLNDVNFELMQNGNILIEQNSKDGTFQFVIVDGDEAFRVKAWKDEYIPKIIHFNAQEFPFINEYEIQEIDIEFRKMTSPLNEAEVGELKWSSLGHVFNVVKVDSSMEYVKERYTQSENQLGQIYATAVDKADEFTRLDKEDYALPLYEVALTAKPNDSYCKRRIMEIKRKQLKPMEEKKEVAKVTKEMLEKVNKGEVQNIPENLSMEGSVFSVQIGAFSGKVDRSKFSKVPDLNVIPYDDYTRVFSGSFKNLNDALNRKKELASIGYKDGWIVQMKDNERIGF